MKSHHISILLVEDNPGDARLIKEMLAEAHRLTHELTLVATYAQTYDHLAHHTPDAVLLDLSLPDGQGLESAIPLIEAFPAVPFIILTGLDDETIGLESVRRGAQDYLIKWQINGKLIVRVISYSIERKQAAIEKEKRAAELLIANKELAFQNEEKERLVRELQELFSQMKTLRGLLPMCNSCKKIRDDKGDWVILETFIQDHSNADIAHGICPECANGLTKARPKT